MSPLNSRLSVHAKRQLKNENGQFLRKFQSVSPFGKTNRFQSVLFSQFRNRASQTKIKYKKEFLHRNMEIWLAGIRICRVPTRHASRHAIRGHLICIMTTDRPRPPRLCVWRANPGALFLFCFFLLHHSRRVTCLGHYH